MLSSNVGQYLSTQSQLNHCELEYCPVSEQQTFRTTRLLSSSCNSIGFVWDRQLIGQPILELSSHLLEIPNDVHMLLSHILIGCLTFSEEYCKLIGLYWKIMIRQLYTLTFPSERYMYVMRLCVQDVCDCHFVSMHCHRYRWFKAKQPTNLTMEKLKKSQRRDVDLTYRAGSSWGGGA